MTAPPSGPSPAPLQEAAASRGSTGSGDSAARARPHEAAAPRGRRFLAPVAIVGLGAVMPHASNAQAFWRNILDGVDCIGEVPRERWDPDLFWDPDPKAEDKTYCKIGAFVRDEDVHFDPLAFRIPPVQAAKMDLVQRMTLVAAREALADARLLEGERDRTRIAVILGNAMGGEVMRDYAWRLGWPLLERSLRTEPAFAALPSETREHILRQAERRFKSGLPTITEDSMPGELSNVIAGRVANVFNFLGKNFTCDAACASSLAALDAACRALAEGEADVVVSGGADRSMDASTYVKFSKIGALSATGSTPFDARADGFVMGEGVGIVVLKRLADALRDGDRVYAVIRGIGSSSDGKGKGITAPNPQGQVLAIRRALDSAGFGAETVGLIEAHGTSTKVGDAIEVRALAEVFGPAVRDRKVGLGSVKSQVGHLKAAAGAASLLKVAMALTDKILPPSLNFETANPALGLHETPFEVVTAPRAWQRIAPGVPRRAGISSFGFGGTNFHVLLEEFDAAYHKRLVAEREAPTMAGAAANETRVAAASDGAGAPPASPAEATLLAPRGVILAAGADDAAALAALGAATTDGFSGRGPSRIAIPLPPGFDPVAVASQVAPLLSGADAARLRLAAAKGAHTNFRDAPLGAILGDDRRLSGKVAFLFPGQGSQYVAMVADLAAEYPVVRATFDEADRVMKEFAGFAITPLIFPAPDASPADLGRAEEALKQTEVCQPAVLAADIALHRLLLAHGIRPDVVAGHSLGEYAALVAAGVLPFADALKAVSARGREMAHVDVPDLGKMAAVTAPIETVESVLAGIDDYVIPANRNCPSMTVIAGSTGGVEKALAAFAAQGVTATPINVSAAFHSSIVAPASEPLRRVLSAMDVRSPSIPILSNVTADYYPTARDGGDAASVRADILDLLARQVAAPVEWTRQVERMYADGVRLFLEVGPKRALATFVSDILKDRPHAVTITNHPKRGGLFHFREALALCHALGILPDEAARAGADTAARTAARSGPWVASTASAGLSPPLAPLAPRPANGAAPEEPLPTTAELAREMRELRALVEGRLAAPGAGPSAGVAPRPSPADSDLERRVAAFGINLDDVVVSGMGLGLPGAHHPLFDDANFDRILSGENQISLLPEAVRRSFADKNIVRLEKGSQGEADFRAISDLSEVIQLAAQKGDFDLVRDFGVDAKFAESLDTTFRLAIAAGFEALRDAGIPLVKTYTKTTRGTFLPGEWVLPEALQEETGVIFACAFPGVDNLISEVSRFLAHKYRGAAKAELRSLYDGLLGAVTDDAARERLAGWFAANWSRIDAPESRYEFNRKFLFNVLSMGHSQFAQLIRARGPNTQVNAACSSTTQAVSIAEDWIRNGRAKRVVVVGADDVTSGHLVEWIGSGFLASGAATTKGRVEDAALPFDRRRHGMVIGMGAVGIVVEARAEVKARGMEGIARLLASEVANSAFHGSRLDTRHIAHRMGELVAKAERRYGIDRARIAGQTLFMSHETYTPARGGSAAAEVEALRATFGADAQKVVVSNTKGFTGHPMGAGIEDVIALKALQRGQVPPIANFKEEDPDLGPLNLSRGGRYDVRYALRLSAGFGSQLAMTLVELLARENERVPDRPAYERWIARLSHHRGHLEVVNRTLRIIDEGAPTPETPRPPAPSGAAVAAPSSWTPAASRPSVPAPPAVPARAMPTQPPAATPAPAGSPPRPAPPVSTPSAPLGAHATAAASRGDVLGQLTALLVEKTGYPADLLDPALQLEADLGIDTVKQAELFGLIRDKYALPREEGVQIKDYPTLNHIADYVSKRLPTNGSAGAAREPNEGPDGSAAGAGPAATAAGASRRASPATTTRAAVAPPPSSAPAAAPASRAPAPPEAAVPTAAPQRPAAPAPTAPTGRADRAAILRDLTSLLVEKTGYPADLLDPALQLEADLGIDTVKQAELFGLIRDKYALPREEGVQIKDYPTMNQIAEYVAGRVAGSGIPGAATGADAGAAVALPTTVTAEEERPAGPASLPPGAGKRTAGDGSAPATATTSASTTPSAPTRAATPADGADASPSDDEAALLREVVALVATKTGYPEDLLDPDLDLEADLGIDTVKQAEIFAEVRDRHRIPKVEGLALKDYATLRKVAGFVVTMRGAATNRSAGAATVLHAGPSPPAARFRAHALRLVPVGSRAARPLAGSGTVLVVGSSPDVVPPIGARFAREGLRAVAVAPNEEGLAAVRALSEPVAGVVDLQPLDPDGEPLAGCLFAFRLARLLHERLAAGAFFLTVSATGGRLGLHMAGADPHAAALGGFTKGLAREYPNAAIRWIDLARLDSGLPDLLASESRLAGPNEVAIDAGGRPHQVALLPLAAPPSAPQAAVPRGSVVLATGGAQGVTAETLATLCATGGRRLALLGRTAWPAEAETLARLSAGEVAARKKEILQALSAGGARVTPVAVEREHAKLVKAWEVARNVHRLRAAGNEVRYLACDVTDASEVESAVAEVERSWGRIGLVLHGAGLESSKLVADKKEEDFAEVFAVKAHGLANVLAALRDLPETLVVFSSVAGRFGNAGQTDYSAANEAASRAAWRLAGRGVRVLVADWSAWDEIGMATRGSVKTVLAAAGVDLLPPADACRILAEELAAGRETEVLVAGSLGMLAGTTPMLEGEPDRPGPPAEGARDRAPDAAARPPRTAPLQPASATAALGAAAMAASAHPLGAAPGACTEVELSGREEFLADHAIDGVPLVPAVCGLDAFLATTRGEWAEVVEASFAAPVKVFPGKRLPVQVEVRPDGALSLTSTFLDPSGRRAGNPRVHFQARVAEGSPAAPEPALARTPRGAATSEAWEVYDRFFHGPRFRVLRSVEWTEGSATGQRAGEPLPGFVRDVLGLEAALQTAGFHNLEAHGTASLPFTVAGLTWRPGAVTKVAARFLGESERAGEHVALYELAGWDAAGAPVFLCREFGLVGVPPFSAPASRRLADALAAHGLPSDAARYERPPLAGGPSIPLLVLDATRLPDGLDLGFLTDREATVVDSFTNPKRRGEVLGSVLSARLLAAALGAGPDGAPVERHADGHYRYAKAVPGTPVTDAWGHLSTTHSGPWIVAAYHPLVRVGLDLEKVEPRSASFVREFLSTDEEAALGPLDARGVTEAWAAKEAVLKVLLKGLSLDLYDVRLSRENGNLRPTLAGRAASASKGGPVTLSVLPHPADAAYRLCVARQDG